MWCIARIMIETGFFWGWLKLPPLCICGVDLRKTKHVSANSVSLLNAATPLVLDGPQIIQQPQIIQPQVWALFYFRFMCNYKDFMRALLQYAKQHKEQAWKVYWKKQLMWIVKLQIYVYGKRLSLKHVYSKHFFGADMTLIWTQN